MEACVEFILSYFKNVITRKLEVKDESFFFSRFSIHISVNIYLRERCEMVKFFLLVKFLKIFPQLLQLESHTMTYGCGE